MPDLTGVRFPLAIWVVASHLSSPGNMLHTFAIGNPGLQALIGAAWMALGIFFAISGFVLTLRYRSQVWTSATLTRYAVARLARVYPVYALSLLIMAPIIAAEIASGISSDGGRSIRALLSYVLLLQGWSQPLVNWNTPAWSLSCELFFYLCFPAIVIALRRVDWLRVAGMTALAFVAAISVRLAGVPVGVKPFIYLADFLAGVAAAGVYQMLMRRGVFLAGRGYLLTGPACLIALTLLCGPEIPFLVLDNLLRAATIVIVLGLALGGNALSSPMFLLCGRASYAIYILHIPILWWYNRLPFLTQWPPQLAALVYVIIVIATSVLVCQWFEQPAEKFLRNHFRGHATAPVATLTCVDLVRRVGISEQAPGRSVGFDTCGEGDRG